MTRVAQKSTSGPHGFRRLPGDILIEIALCLEKRLDILNLCLTVHPVFSHVCCVLYETVILSSVEQCQVTLGMLMKHTEIARHVRHLVVRPNSERGRIYGSVDSESASAAVRQLAGAKALDALVRFEWEADELPYCEDMWFALRLGCPQLRSISTCIGSMLPTRCSHIFDFQNLSGFSLTLKPGFYDNSIDMFDEEPSVIFNRFWDMLINKCPNLEELVLNGRSPVPADIHFIVAGRWPRLRKLSLGDVCVDWFPTALVPGEKRPFITFLEEHPLLESLSLSRHAIQPIHFNSLDPSALPYISHFSGTYQQLQAMPNLHGSVSSVTFCDPVETREVSSLTIASLLRDLRCLTELRIAFTLHSMYDSGTLLRSLMQSCPALHHLGLTCAEKPSFQLEAFAKTIRGFIKLRSLHLTVVRSPGDDSLLAGAIQIATANPRIKNFELAYITPASPIPLPFAIPYRAILFALAFPIKSAAKFEVERDTHGLPLSLSGTERNTFQWPWGMGRSVKTKKHFRDLRPPASRRQSGGFQNFLTLVVERSEAGEEIRMILFCTFLAVLAACGISANSGHRSSTIVADELATAMIPETASL
ncbi:hypothetical protein CPB83DRAFT_857681 [Crepidotus variabilis]|uniref:F-box domain-containing protein n=1 Tax=Crepidotus variabilis TaxID=179855 RepID=A0A9P6ECS5_9AGAR|nr:hypothetical protein CPB83DRAFT_857681 [Crepidotus variabilis]